jgi:hypothetical protein
VSRRLKRQLGKAPVGRRRGSNPPPGPRAVARTPEQRLNRYLLIGGSFLAFGAVMVAVTTHPFTSATLATLGINLLAIGLGLLMGKGFGRFLFRRVLPADK